MIEEQEQGILSGHEIWREVTAGNITVTPEPNAGCYNPASLDLTLGSKVAVYCSSVYFIVGDRAYYYDEESGAVRNRHGEALTVNNPFVDQQLAVNPQCRLDSRRKNDVFTFDMNPQRGWLLKPGIGYLMHTAERIHTKRFVPVLDGKSSLGRLFMTAHVTAGYGDPGFDGQYTLEVIVTHPVVVYPGMRFCQIRFHTLVGRSRGHTTYEHKGHYVGADAEGPVPSMSWKQFEEQERGAE